MSDEINESQLVHELREASQGGMSKFAYRHGFTPAHLSQVLHRKRRPSDKMAAALGRRRIVLFEKISDE